VSTSILTRWFVFAGPERAARTNSPPDVSATASVLVRTTGSDVCAWAGSTMVSIIGLCQQTTVAAEPVMPSALISLRRSGALAWLDASYSSLFLFTVVSPRSLQMNTEQVL